jgi:hypothetical protein
VGIGVAVLVGSGVAVAVGEGDKVAASVIVGAGETVGRGVVCKPPQPASERTASVSKIETTGNIRPDGMRDDRDKSHSFPVGFHACLADHGSAVAVSGHSAPKHTSCQRKGVPRMLEIHDEAPTSSSTSCLRGSLVHGVTGKDHLASKELIASLVRSEWRVRAQRTTWARCAVRTLRGNGKKTHGLRRSRAELVLAGRLLCIALTGAMTTGLQATPWHRASRACRNPR